MANSTLHTLTAKTTIATTDEFYGVQIPYGAGDDRRFTLNPLNMDAVAFASLPTATDGRVARVSNVGPSGFGSLWAANGTRWYPVNGHVPIGSVDTNQTTTSTTTLAMANFLIPATSWQNKDRMRLRAQFTKSGVAETLSINVRFSSTSGDIAGTVIKAFSMAATDDTGGFLVDFRRESATSVLPIAMASLTVGSYPGTNTSNVSSAVTVTNMDSNAMYFIITGAMNTGVETGTLIEATLEMFSTVN
jgi:hypothetical protein